MNSQYYKYNTNSRDDLITKSDFNPLFKDYWYTKINL